MVIYKIYKFIKKNNIEIIHCHNAFSLKIAYLLKKFLTIKVIFTVHDTNVYSGKLNKYPVDKYIAISQSVYKVINTFVPKNKIELIYNGVDISKFRKSYRPVNRQADAVNIACVARVVPEKKGQDTLIKALGILKNDYKFEGFKCYFAGDIPDQKALKQLQELVTLFKLEKNVEFMGNVQQVENLYAKTDIFVLPSRYEGFGLVVVEALAAGCSVVVSKLEGPLEIVKDNEEYGLIFEKDNDQQLARKLMHLINDEEYRSKYSNNSKSQQYIEREYSVEKMIRTYNRIYKEAVQQTG